MPGITDETLRSDVLRVLDAGVDVPLDDAAFDALALRAFAWQFATNPPYARYCERRGRTPATVRHWTQIPPVPTAAFKAIDFTSGDATAPDAVFMTSGTTRGSEQRGRHVILDLELYRRAALPNFSAHFLPDEARLPFFCLAPRAARQPDSSLAWMIELVATELAAEARWFVEPDRGLDAARLIDALDHAVSEHRPVALVGTTLAFVHLLDALAHGNRTLRLPHGSRLMDTGGFKGSGRDIVPGDLVAAYRDRLGIDADHRVNEYGMTEMCSQFYDTRLLDSIRGTQRDAAYAAPPWVRTRAVDPDSLDPLPTGTVGILQHFDLANLGSVVAIQTEDLGVVDGDRFTLLGRAPGAEPRGCSIAMDILLRDRAARRS